MQVYLICIVVTHICTSFNKKNLLSAKPHTTSLLLFFIFCKLELGNFNDMFCYHQ